MSLLSDQCLQPQPTAGTAVTTHSSHYSGERGSSVGGVSGLGHSPPPNSLPGPTFCWRITYSSPSSSSSGSLVYIFSSLAVNLPGSESPSDGRFRFLRVVTDCGCPPTRQHATS